MDNQNLIVGMYTMNAIEQSGSEMRKLKILQEKLQKVSMDLLLDLANI